MKHLTRKQRLYLGLTALTALLLCCILSLCAASLLPSPTAEPAAWSALAQTASTSRLMAFLATLAFGNGCTGAGLPISLIIGLLALLLWRTRPGGAQ